MNDDPTIIPSWGAVASHAEERIASVRTALETASADTIPALQAEVRVLRSILALPTTLSPKIDLEPEPAPY